MLPVQHAIGVGNNVEFVNRGALLFRSLKSVSGTFQQLSSLSVDFREQLRESSLNKNTLYRIRVPTKLGASFDDSNVKYVSTFIKACSLYESKLNDLITVTIDQKGDILGVSIVPLVGDCKGHDIDEVDLTHFNTSVELATIITGPVPETQAYIQKLEEEKAQREGKGNSTEQKSFFGKYWMYIVPIVLFLMLSGAQDPNAQRGGGGSS
ncbi:ER membrane protein complex subunit 10-like [Saccoglossus kowalevskii]|uniref:ER membrane protein complex subunit 10 n=1 Tax=Saccoglossus kowalevskii TaxID=10224 RepID=A0ABM0MD92_SACKO|nr:PREDICTED: ER membrane protein complex subunit 10-like [Saccoglossus kowalevskii]